MNTDIHENTFAGTADDLDLEGQKKFTHENKLLRIIFVVCFLLIFQWSLKIQIYCFFSINIYVNLISTLYGLHLKSHSPQFVKILKKY